MLPPPRGKSRGRPRFRPGPVAGMDSGRSGDGPLGEDVVLLVVGVLALALRLKAISV